MFKTMAALSRRGKSIKLHRSVTLRSFYSHNRFGLYQHHHRFIHLKLYRSRLNIHNSHLRKFWKKYTLLISLSAVGVTLANRTDPTTIVSADSVQKDEEEMIEKEEEEKRLEEEAIEHLIQTISVPKHNLIVWLWLFFGRFAFLVYNFTPMLLLAPFAYFNIFGIKSYWLNLMHDSFANGGSTFIKLGQWISMRSDLFPIEICDSLSELRMRAPAHSFEETCEVIKEAFGKDIDEIFDRFYIEPTASGSIAQVHKAQICINPGDSSNYFEDDMYKGNRTLLDWIMNSFITKRHETERKISKPKYLDVAVKVRHPDILQNMYIDITIMYMLSNFISSIPGFAGLKFPIHQKNFTQYLESQIDLSYEGRSLQKMHVNFEKHRLTEDENVIFPEVIEGLSTSSVLVETWEYGVPLCNLDLNKLTNECRHSIAKQCYDVFMKMALRDNFVHGDCHSGNILIRAIDVTEGEEDNNNKSLASILKDKTERLSNTIQQNTNIPLLKKEEEETVTNQALQRRDIEGPLIFLDAGLTASLTKEGHHRFGVMMGHIATAKCDKAAEIFGSWTVMDPISDPTCYQRRDRFVNELSEIIENSLRWRYKDKNGNVIPNKGIPFISIGPLLRNVLILTQKEHIVLDSSFSAVIASLGIIEGLIKTLDPSADFLQWGVPYLVKYRKLDSLRYLLTQS